ncbi:hypothetical protein D3C76_921260 [compost metagenome]
MDTRPDPQRLGCPAAGREKELPAPVDRGFQTGGRPQRGHEAVPPDPGERCHRPLVPGAGATLGQAFGYLQDHTASNDSGKNRTQRQAQDIDHANVLMGCGKEKLRLPPE